MTISSRITLGQFIERRLGKGTDTGALLREMFVRSFGAGSFQDFWRYWNPVYGYILYYYCYKPLRRVLPRPVAVLLTFFSSGFFLHDLPFGWWIRALRAQSLPVPFVALWFTLIGVLVLIGAALNLNFAQQPFRVRVLINVLHIVGAFLVALFLMGLI